MTETALPPPADAKLQGRQASLVFVLILVALDVLSFGVTIPVYPRLFEKFTGGDVAQASALLGAFMTLFAAVQLFAAPILGALSDRYGRRPVILLACAGLGIDLFVMAWAPNLWWLLLARVVHAVTAANQAVAMAYVADVTPPQERARAFGFIGATFGVAFIIGPAVGGLLGEIDMRLPFLCGGAMALLNVAYGYFVLPESLPPERRRPFQLRQANPIGVLNFLRTDRLVFTLAGALFMIQLSQQVFPSVWVLYTSSRFGWSSMTIGLTLGFAGLLTAIVQGVLVGPAIKVLGERAAIVIGLSLTCLQYALVAFVPLGWMFVALMPLGALAGIAGPALNAVLSRRIAPDRQGELQGATTSMMSVTGMIGPTLFAGSFAFALSPAAPFEFPGLPFLIAAALLCVAVTLAVRATAGMQK